MNKIKSFLNSVGKEFIYGGHLISLGASSVVLTSAILLNIPITWDFLLIVYLITYTVYLYNRFKEFDEDFLTNPDRTQHIGGYIKYTPLIVFCSILVVVGLLLCFSNFLSLIFGLLLLLLGVLYSVCLKKVTKKIVGFKSFYVSFIWALLVIFLAIYYSFPLSLSVFLIVFFVFLRCMIITSFCDVKDVESDSKENLLTLIVTYKKEGLVKLLIIFNVLSAALIIIGIYLSLFSLFSLMLIFTFFYSSCYLRKLSDRKITSPFLYDVFVDGEKFLWSIFVLWGKFLTC